MLEFPVKGAAVLVAQRIEELVRSHHHGLYLVCSGQNFGIRSALNRVGFQNILPDFIHSRASLHHIHKGRLVFYVLEVCGGHL